jgi:cytoskeleton protein RodZ
MNATIGQKLQEARKKRGLSIKDASDYLKIKVDFLNNFENDRFDFNLPEVYMYGFLKLYVNYLKLDAKALMAQYSELKQLNPQGGYQRESRESLGRMQFNKKPQLIDDRLSTNFKVIENDPGLSMEEGPAAFSSKPSYKKPLFFFLGLAFLGIICILLTLLWGWWHKRSGSATEVSVHTAPAEISDNRDPSANDFVEETLTLSADNDVHVVIRQDVDKQRLFSGTIGPKQPQTLSRKGPVKIHFSDGTSLIIQKANGQKIKPARSGVGWVGV